MQISNFSTLLTYKEKIENLYLALELKFNPSSRIGKYFHYLEKIEKVRSLGKDKLTDLIEKDKARYYFSQYYVLEICAIVDAIEKGGQDERIIKEKLLKLSKGTYLLSEESGSNKKARDVQFELSLFSFLSEKGANVELCDPNPDIQLLTNEFRYKIECKRPYSIRSLEKLTRESVGSYTVDKCCRLDDFKKDEWHKYVIMY